MKTNKQKEKEIKKTLSSAINESIKSQISQIFNGLIFFDEGDLVKINVKKIKDEPNYEDMPEGYKKFVDEAMGKIWTIEYDPSYLNPPVLVVFKEDPLPKQKKWLFYIDYLERVVQ